MVTNRAIDHHQPLQIIWKPGLTHRLQMVAYRATDHHQLLQIIWKPGFSHIFKIHD